MWGLCSPACPVPPSPSFSRILYSSYQQGWAKQNEQGAPGILELQQVGWLLRTPWLSWLQEILQGPRLIQAEPEQHEQALLPIELVVHAFLNYKVSWKQMEHLPGRENRPVSPKQVQHWEGLCRLERCLWDVHVSSALTKGTSL